MKYIRGKVSICVAQFNRADRIQASIGSLLGQDYKDFEVIVVNDGSTDLGVKEALNAIEDDKLKVIHQHNTGFVGAMRRAIESSDGEFIAIHGAGDISLSDRVAKQATFLQAHPEYCLVSCHYSDVEINDKGEGPRTLFAKASGEVPESDLTYKPSPIGHGEVMYRREAYESAGGYRSFFKFAQDKDLWLRLIKFGRFYVLPENLYERGLFLIDGIATNNEKLYLQKLLMAFAVQCYEVKQKTGVDLVEKYGNQSGLLRKRSAKVSDFCFITSLRAYISGDYNEAVTFIKRANAEKIQFKALVLFLIIRLSRNDKIYSSFRKSMRTIRRIKQKMPRSLK